jgi:TatD DNase family protein
LPNCIIDTHTHLCDTVFDADRDQVLEHAREAGYFFSIPPSIVRSRQKQKLVKALPLDALLLETDSPVLGPDAKKQRNEPANARRVVDAIAAIKKVTPEEVVETAFVNTINLYGDRIVG